MEEFNIIRHGFKPEVGEEGIKPVEESGLSREDQEAWLEAVAALGIENDPGITYDSFSLIKERAREIYEKLPSKALVVLASTDYPRTKLTAYLLSGELEKIVKNKFGDEDNKDVRVAFLWESPEEAGQKNSMSNVVDITEESKRNQELMGISQEADEEEGVFKKYLEHGANRGFKDENEKLRQAVNIDLASDDSAYRKRVELFRQQLQKIEDGFSDEELPVYFFGVGHHPNLVTLDVAFNGREHYSEADEIPQPLTLWGVDRKKIKKFLESK
jgi:hypothetical protein